MPRRAGCLRAADAAGRLSVVATYFGPDEMRQASSGPDISVAGWMKHRERYFYNGDGQLVQQVSEGRLKNWQAWIGVPVGFDFTTVATGYSFMLDKISETFTTYNALGLVGAYDYHYIQHEAGSGASDTDPQDYWQYFSVNYEGRDGYLEKSTAGTSSNPNYQATTSYSKYDAWGKLMAVREKTPLPTDMGTMDDRIRYFTYDGEGGILRRRQGTQANGVFSQTSGEVSKDEIYAYTNGQQVARQTREGKVDIAGRHTAYDSMDQGAATVLVQRGDTLQSLAQRVYGNSQLWYVLADANAMGNTDPIAGTTLKVPDVGAVNKNDAATFKPYNPGEAIGSTAPGLPYMQAPDCPFWKVLVMAVIIVVVTYFTMGAATEAVGGLAAGSTEVVAGDSIAAGLMSAAGTAGTAAEIAGAFVGGVAGSVAGQLAGKALGIVDHFSLRQAFADGLANAFSAGLTKLGAVGDLIKNSHWGVVAMQAALNGVTGYVANKIAGVPNTHFSWTQVASSSVASFVTSAAFGNTPQQDQITGAKTTGTVSQLMGREFARDVTHQMVSSLVQVAISGKSSGDNDGMWVASALGSAIGYGIVGATPGTDLYKSLHPTGPTHEQFMASTAYLKDGQNADDGNAFVLPGASAPVQGDPLGLFTPKVNAATDDAVPSTIPYTAQRGDTPDIVSEKLWGTRMGAAYVMAQFGITDPTKLRAGATAELMSVLDDDTLAWSAGIMKPAYRRADAIAAERQAAELAALDGPAAPIPAYLLRRPGSGGGGSGGTGISPPTDSLESIHNLYDPRVGAYEQAFSETWDAVKANNSILDKIEGVELLAGLALPTMADMLISGAYNAPNAAGRAGQYAARATLQSDVGNSNLDVMYAFQEFLGGFQGLGNAASLGVLSPVRAPTQIAGTTEKVADSGLDLARARDLAIAPDAHAYTKHGGWVTDSLLQERAWTGISPGSTTPSFRYPSASSAFHSNEVLEFADSAVRSSGILEARLAANPTLRNIQINPSMIGDLGVDLGRGYIPVRPFEPIGSAYFQGPLLRVNNMTSVGGIYRYNLATQNFDMITLYPAVRK